MSEQDFIDMIQAENTRLREELAQLEAIQHGRNWDDDEAERKLRWIAKDYAKLKLQFELYRMALYVSNETEYYYAWMPKEDNHLESLAEDRPVRISSTWLKELIEEAREQATLYAETALAAAKGREGALHKHLVLTLEALDINPPVNFAIYLEAQKVLSTDGWAYAERVKRMKEALEAVIYRCDFHRGVDGNPNWGPDSEEYQFIKAALEVTEDGS